MNPKFLANPALQKLFLTYLINPEPQPLPMKKKCIPQTAQMTMENIQCHPLKGSSMNHTVTHVQNHDQSQQIRLSHERALRPAEHGDRCKATLSLSKCR